MALPDSPLSQATPHHWRRISKSFESSPSLSQPSIAKNRDEQTTNIACWARGTKREVLAGTLRPAKTQDNNKV
ncbi:hypothetical protein N7450_008456 [Penicillium hetheringtonii]|uniref:Uncharacterized protein n=1 Tax=Penicillium hetheringtonii TaxID=911720 RepID=A0AAD6GNA6_9EURO|nr:hypothetical protein N7450_008456 [Penicillium hetheringtonii]